MEHTNRQDVVETCVM